MADEAPMHAAALMAEEAPRHAAEAGALGGGPDDDERYWVLFIAVTCFLYGALASWWWHRRRDLCNHLQHAVPQLTPTPEDGGDDHAAAADDDDGDGAEFVGPLSSAPALSPSATKHTGAHISIDDLLLKHRTAVCNLYHAIKGHPSFDAAKHDDLFLLRYVLSYPKHKAAVRAASVALASRAALRLDETRAETLRLPSREWVERSTRPWAHLMPAMVLQPDANGTLALYVDARHVNMHDVLRVPRDDFNRAQRTMMEFIHHRMDRATRSTGNLVKYNRIINLAGVSLSTVSPRFVRRDAEDNKELQGLYPQLMGAVIFVNPPAALDVLYRTLLPLIPAKIAEKTVVLAPLKRRRDLERLVELSGLPLEELPVACGGKRTDHPRDTSEPARPVAEAGTAALRAAMAAGVSLREQLNVYFAACDKAAAALPADPDHAGGRAAEGPGGGPLWWSARPLHPSRSWWSATGR